MSLTSVVKLCLFPTKMMFGQVRYAGTIPIILIQDIEKRGQKGDIIHVRRGFARNLLVPRKMAGKN